MLLTRLTYTWVNSHSMVNSIDQWLANEISNYFLCLATYDVSKVGHKIHVYIMATFYSNSRKSKALLLRGQPKRDVSNP
jgi:hypothetical protein